MIPQKLAAVTPIHNCPWWCVNDHTGESAGARVHWASTPEMPLTLDGPADDRTVLLADLVFDETDSRGLVVELCSRMGGGWNLTLDEVDRLADSLRILAASARSARGLSPDQLASCVVQAVVAPGGEVL